MAQVAICTFFYSTNLVLNSLSLTQMGIYRDICFSKCPLKKIGYLLLYNYKFASAFDKRIYIL